MQFPLKRPCKFVFFAGLVTALILGIIGACSMHTVSRSRLADMDARAQPFFDEAHQNVPAVEGRLSRYRAQLRICWYMLRDKVSGTHRTRDYLNSVIAEPILEPCRKGAKVYGCDLDSDSLEAALKEINAASAVTEAYAAGGLAIEVIFLRSTISAVRSVLGAVVSKLAVSYGGGAACAAADGPFPFGDAVGLVLAAGGTLWSLHDIYVAQKQLPSALAETLHQAINDCQNACRVEAVR